MNQPEVLESLQGFWDLLEKQCANRAGGVYTVTLGQCTITLCVTLTTCATIIAAAINDHAQTTKPRGLLG